MPYNQNVFAFHTNRWHCFHNFPSKIPFMINQFCYLYFLCQQQTMFPWKPDCRKPAVQSEIAWQAELWERLIDSRYISVGYQLGLVLVVRVCLSIYGFCLLYYLAEAFIQSDLNSDTCHEEPSKLTFVINEQVNSYFVVNEQVSPTCSLTASYCTIITMCLCWLCGCVLVNNQNGPSIILSELEIIMNRKKKTSSPEKASI